MLADPRARVLVQNFAGQWLYLRNLPALVPDAVAFPEFDENLRNAFRQESEMFFENLIREDRSVIDLLGSDYAYVNERLAQHYGIPGVYGSHFRRVQLDAELAAQRGGILGQGSLLMATSYANRTSPVLRGKWILTNILGTPPSADGALSERRTWRSTPRGSCPTAGSSMGPRACGHCCWSANRHSAVP